MMKIPKKLLPFFAAFYLADAGGGTPPVPAPVIENITSTPEVTELCPYIIPSHGIAYFQHKNDEHGYSQVNQVYILDKDGKRTCITKDVENHVFFSIESSPGRRYISFFGRDVSKESVGETFIVDLENNNIVARIEKTEDYMHWLAGKLFYLSDEDGNVGIRSFDPETGKKEKPTEAEITRVNMERRKLPNITIQDENMFIDTDKGRIVIPRGCDPARDKTGEHVAFSYKTDDGFQIGIVSVKTGKRIGGFKGRHACWDENGSIVYTDGGDLQRLKLDLGVLDK